jgi:hypothetical protein
LVFVPALGGRWETFFIPRATLAVWLMVAVPWWRGWWTPLEWVLCAGILAQTVRGWSPWSTGRGAVWLAGFDLLRAVRGLPEADRDFLRRWWWAPMPVVLGYAFLQVWAPAWDPWGTQIRVLTHGNSLSPPKRRFCSSGKHRDGYPVAVARGPVGLARGPGTGGRGVCRPAGRWALAGGPGRGLWLVDARIR